MIYGFLFPVQTISPPLQFYFTFYIAISESPFLFSLSYGSDSALSGILRGSSVSSQIPGAFSPANFSAEVALVPKALTFHCLPCYAPQESSADFLEVSGYQTFPLLCSTVVQCVWDLGILVTCAYPWGGKTFLSSVVANFTPGLNFCSFCFLVVDSGIAFSIVWKEKESINYLRWIKKNKEIKVTTPKSLSSLRSQGSQIQQKPPRPSPSVMFFAILHKACHSHSLESINDDNLVTE